MAEKDKTKEEFIEEIKLLQKRIAEFEKLNSELKQQQQQQQQQQQEIRRLATVMRDSSDAIIIQDIDGRITAWNRGAELMYGYNEEEALGMNIERLTSPGKVAEQKEFTRRLIAGEAVASFETQRVTKDGRILDVWLTVTKLLEDPADNIISTGRDIAKLTSIALIERNISERKKAEENLRIQDEIMKNLAEGVYLVRLEDGIIVYANPKCENMFGYHSGEMIGKDVSIVNAPGEKTPEEIKNEIMDIVKKTGEWHGEVKNIKKDGTHFYCYANVSLFDHPDYGKVAISIHINITKRKEIEKTLRQLSAIVENTTDFVSTASLDKKLLFLNKAGRKMVGIGETEDISNLQISNMHSKWAGDIILSKGIPTAMSEGIWTGEVALLHRDGHDIPVSQVIIAHKKADGSLEYLSTIMRNITERKKMEEEARKRLHELEIFYKASVSREERILELKKEIEQLKTERNK
jgi:PAS domain S-box-containing protein